MSQNRRFCSRGTSCTFFFGFDKTTWTTARKPIHPWITDIFVLLGEWNTGLAAAISHLWFHLAWVVASHLWNGLLDWIDQRGTVSSEWARPTCSFIGSEWASLGDYTEYVRIQEFRNSCCTRTLKSLLPGTCPMKMAGDAHTFVTWKQSHYYLSEELISLFRVAVPIQPLSTWLTWSLHSPYQPNLPG